mmetsp:Transcript_34833/g.84223  ORF Transcript_34833/g.84223 Transcript_34833/m.84223 type:complete len:225 (+) Transcript_34833:2316-2990(+)
MVVYVPGRIPHDGSYHANNDRYSTMSGGTMVSRTGHHGSYPTDLRQVQGSVWTTLLLRHLLPGGTEYRCLHLQCRHRLGQSSSSVLGTMLVSLYPSGLWRSGNSSRDANFPVHASVRSQVEILVDDHPTTCVSDRAYLDLLPVPKLRRHHLCRNASLPSRLRQPPIRYLIVPLFFSFLELFSCCSDCDRCCFSLFYCTLITLLLLHNMMLLLLCWLIFPYRNSR